jgi:cytochrome c-type biogenesis protein CcmH/NrfG
MPLVRATPDLVRALGAAGESAPEPFRRDLPAGHPVILIVGSDRSGRLAAAAAVVERRLQTHRRACLWIDENPAGWPFRRHVQAGVPTGSSNSWPVVLVHDIERAFPNRQTGGTRLVLTQSTYQLQRWIDALEPAGGLIVATADAARLEHEAPEALARRGPWARALSLSATDGRSVEASLSGPDQEPPAAAAPDRIETDNEEVETGVAGPGPLLCRAFRSPPIERLAMCRETVERHPRSPVGWLALASALMELTEQSGGLEAAVAALGRAERLAPDWEAVHFEKGKLCLRLDDMAGARTAFAEAGRLMPSFSAAFGNLGAALGELERPEEALAAFEHALRYDPAGFTLFNNIGVVNRERGRLDVAESAFRRTIELAPSFVFGYYNLGHTLFLAGRFSEAVEAYERGQRRDPDRSPRQAARLAYSRLAAGQAGRALEEFRQALAGVALDQRSALVAEADEVLRGLLAITPDLAGASELRALIEPGPAPNARSGAG